MRDTKASCARICAIFIYSSNTMENPRACTAASPCSRSRGGLMKNTLVALITSCILFMLVCRRACVLHHPHGPCGYRGAVCLG